MKQPVQTKSAALVAATNQEIEEDRRVHSLRAASFRLERRLHDIKTRAFEAEAQARADYLAEIEAADRRQSERIPSDVSGHQGSQAGRNRRTMRERFRLLGGRGRVDRGVRERPRVGR
jgi:hypothetical protein